jgi:hypothetical protein
MRRRDAVRTMSFHDVRDALARPGCAVCRLKTDSAERFLDGFLWESVNDPSKRREIRRALGFCHEHAWALVRVSASLGVAIVTRDVLRSLLKAMEDATFQALPTFSLRRVHEALDSKQSAAATAELVARLAPQTKCPACVWVEKMEGIYLNTLVHNLLGEDGLLADYEASDGLCLPHFRQALTQVRDEGVFEALVSAQRAILERLVAHLDESIRKSDYRFLDESWGEETGAWLRAIAALVGPRPDRDRRDKRPLWSFRQSAQS